MPRARSETTALEDSGRPVKWASEDVCDAITVRKPKREAAPDTLDTPARGAGLKISESNDRQVRDFRPIAAPRGEPGPAELKP